jgi:hypothetical protein
MKQILIVFTLVVFSLTAHSQVQLNGVTFGFGAGFSNLLQIPNGYTLSPDSLPTLQIQKLSKSSFVISSVISVKLASVAVNDSNKLSKFIAEGQTEPLKWRQRFTVDASLNLLEVSNSNLSFNKNIEGGIGVGYLINENVHVAIFGDFNRVRQLRDYITEKYTNKPIPNGNSFYNALDENDNKLFYTKTMKGISFKVVFSLGNKKLNTNSSSNSKSNSKTDSKSDSKSD